MILFRSILFWGIFNISFIYPQDIKFEQIPHEGTQYIGTVHSILQDQSGFLWLGTVNGLFRYDGYTFKAFLHNPDDSNSISGNHIWSICEDTNGDLWIGTSGRGLNKFIRKENRFIRFRHNPDDSTTLAGGSEIPFITIDTEGNILLSLWEDGFDQYNIDENKFYHTEIRTVDEQGIPRSSVHRVYEDKSGDLWIGTKRGLFKQKKGEKKLISYRHDPSNPKSIGGDYIYSIVEDREGNLWFGSKGGGISRYIPGNDDFINYHHNPDNETSLSSNLVTSMCVDSSGLIWIGTDGYGLNQFNPVSGKFIRYKFLQSSSLISDNITSLYTDKSGVLWIGEAASGLIKYSRNKTKFIHHKLLSENSGSVIVNAILEDKDGITWIGTASSGLYMFNPADKKYTRFKNNPKNKNSLGSNSISALCEDKFGNLWIGTSNGLSYLDKKGNTFTRFFQGAIRDRITSFLIDSNGYLWIGTDGQSVSIYDTKNKNFIYNGYDSDSSFYGLKNVFAIYEDSKKNIWIGCWGEGAAKFNFVSNSAVKFQLNPNELSVISTYNVVSIEEDLFGNLWFGTWGEGLFKIDVEGKISRYTTANGLPNNIIYKILSDENGNIWVSTSSGIAKLNTKDNQWKTYDIQDGLQSMEFVHGSGDKGSSGKFYFGGLNGYNEFYPAKIVNNKHKPNIVLTSFKVSGKELTDDKFNGSIELLRELTLPYNQNNISFEFTALEFTHPQKNKYAYMLEGFDNDWIYSGNLRTASYTNLDPGEYILKIKGSNNDGVWSEGSFGNEKGNAIKLTITTPPWKTWWAYTIYFIVIASVLYGIRRYELNRLHLKNQLKIKDIESKKLKEVNQLKSKFFANISHEFRTPLTLILGPIEDALAKISNDSIKSQLKTASKNAKKLLRLINQLLDLSKIETGRMELKASEQDIITFLKGILFTFDSLSKQKKIRLQFRSDLSFIKVFIDSEKFEQVFYNLIINAIKFTPDGSDGIITVSVVKPERCLLKNLQVDSECIQISIKDNGIGMPAGELPNIFNRFYQINDPSANDYEGSGIGLSLAKEIVELHYGRIMVESEPGKGTEFIVILPTGKAHLKKAEIIEEPVNNIQPAIEMKEDEIIVLTSPKVQIGRNQILEQEEDNSEIILVVEDNSEMRNYICQHLKLNYKLIEAPDGNEGFEKAAIRIPDLILSDVMMPGTNGYELCSKLKNDERTSHIPVILLTAKVGEESKLEGLEIGADDYLTKPFSSKELLIRVKNLIGQRQKLREKFSKEGFLKPGKTPISSIDVQFLNKVKKVVEKNIGDENFSVEILADEVAMSRVQLHRKLRGLVNFSASEFIMTLRLQHASELIKQNAGTISEIAYAAGFNTPNYFAKCFKKQFGCSPTEYKIKVN